MDFSHYRRAMLERRIANHLSATGATGETEYLQRLLGSADEPFRLVERITIKVSRFYRHAHTFDYLRDTVLPDLGSRPYGPTATNRVRGLRRRRGAVYLLAMLLEQAGLEGTIHATDLDTTALDAAKIETIRRTQRSSCRLSLRDRWLDPVVTRGQPRYRVPENLRARVSFCTRRHNRRQSRQRLRPSKLPQCAHLSTAFRSSASDWPSARNDS